MSTTTPASASGRKRSASDQDEDQHQNESPTNATSYLLSTVRSTLGSIFSTARKKRRKLSSSSPPSGTSNGNAAAGAAAAGAGSGGAGGAVHHEHRSPVPRLNLHTGVGSPPFASPPAAAQQPAVQQVNPIVPNVAPFAVGTAATAGSATKTPTAGTRRVAFAGGVSVREERMRSPPGSAFAGERGSRKPGRVRTQTPYHPRRHGRAGPTSSYQTPSKSLAVVPVRRTPKTTPSGKSKSSILRSNRRSSAGEYRGYRPNSRTLVSIKPRRSSTGGGMKAVEEIKRRRANDELVKQILRQANEITRGASGPTAIQEEKKDDGAGSSGGLFGPVTVQRVMGTNQSGSRMPHPVQHPRTPKTPAAGAASQGQSQDQSHPHVQFRTVTSNDSLTSHDANAPHAHYNKTPYPGRGRDIVPPTSPAAAHGVDKTTGMIPNGHVHFAMGGHELKRKEEILPHDSYPGRGGAGAGVAPTTPAATMGQGTAAATTVRPIVPTPSQPLQTPARGATSSSASGGIRFVGPPETPRDKDGKVLTPPPGLEDEGTNGEASEFTFTPSKAVPADELTDKVEADMAIELAGIDNAGPNAAGSRRRVEFVFSEEMTSPIEFRRKHSSKQVKKKKAVKGTPHPSKKKGGGDDNGGTTTGAPQPSLFAAGFASPPPAAASGSALPYGTMSTAGDKDKSSAGAGPGGTTLEKARRTAEATAKKKAKEESSSPKPAPAAPAPAPASAPKAPVIGWGNTFKAKEGSWVCDACRVRNEKEDVKCAACETPKPDGAGGAAPPPAAAAAAAAAEPAAQAPAAAAEPAAQAPAPVAAAGSIGPGGFSFGTDSTGTTAKKDEDKPAGSIGAGGFSFVAASADTTAKKDEDKPAGGGGSAPLTAPSGDKKHESDNKADAAPAPAAGGVNFGASSGTSAAPAPAASTGGFPFPMPAAPAKKDEEKKAADSAPPPASSSDWSCKCGSSNPATVLKCLSCGNDKDSASDGGKKKREAAAPAFGGFGSAASSAPTPAAAPATGGLGFGTTPAAATGDKSKTEGPEFSFGGASTFTKKDEEKATEQKKDEAPKPAFTFGSAGAGAAATTAPAFPAASAPAESSSGRLEDNRAPKKKRSMGANDSGPAAVPKPPFAFGAAAAPAPPPAAPPSAPLFSFGTSAPTPPPPSQPTANPPAPAFAFGSSAPANPPPPAPTGGAPFTFGAAAPQQQAPPPAPQGFGFGSSSQPGSQNSSQSASPVPPLFGFGSAAAPQQATAPAFGAPPPQQPAAPGFGAAPPQPGGFGAPTGGGFSSQAAPTVDPNAFGAAAAAPGAGFSIGTGGSSGASKGRRRYVRAKRPPR